MKTFFICFFLSASFSLYGSSSINLSVVHEKLVQADPRNVGIDFRLVEEGDNLGFCINHVDKLSSQNDVFRIFLQAAAELKEQSYHSIFLCYLGQTRYVLSGYDFSVIGEDFGRQNIMFTVRTFPEKLKLPDGKRAFDKHRGGIIYVANKQIADFSIMNKNWYLNDIVKIRQAEKDARRPKFFAKDEDVF
ncbi:hypothetical protein [Marinomonas epiphytica]